MTQGWILIQAEVGQSAAFLKMIADSYHGRVIRNQQYLYPKFPPTAVVKLLQYSGLRSNT